MTTVVNGPVCWLDSPAPAEAIGGKGYALTRLVAAGLPVPLGFCVTVDAMEHLDDTDVRVAVEMAASRLSGRVAVRSSAVGEDGALAAFAGIHTTLLNVRPERELLDALARVGESAHSPAAMTYRSRRGVEGRPRAGAVVQAMVRAECAGVAFTRHPVTGAERIVIEGAWGLGEAVVSGLVTPDHWELDPDGTVLECTPGDKPLAVRPSDGGTITLEVEPELRSRPCLELDMLARVAWLALGCETLFGAPQDVEFAVVDGGVQLLQSRPITSLPS